MTTNKNNSYGTFDQEINTFFKDAHHFASLINTCLYQGQEIVKPQDLMRVDPKILVYKDQMDTLEKEHRKKKDLRSSEEFLSGINASDKLIPCITIVIYYGTRPWQTNFDVKDMSSLIDFKMNLIEVHSDTHQYKDKELDLVFSITRDILNANFNTIRNKYKQGIPKLVTLVIASMAKDEELYQQIKEEEKEVIVMCESLDRMREEASNKGFIKGKTQGKTEGIQIGKEDGILMILTNLLKKGISDSYILEITGVSSELLIKAKQSGLSRKVCK